MDEQLRQHILMIAIQSLGVASMVVARVGERSRVRHLAQSVFFTCLMLVGGLTLWAITSGGCCWLSCGATLSVMSVGATVDFGGSTSSSRF